jgi:protein-disulfide isomerase
MTKTQAPVSRRTILAITVTVAVLATALLIFLSQSGNGGGDENLYAGIPQNGTTLGEADAPVTLMLYEDFQCPYCGQFSREILPQVIEDHVRSGEVKVRSLPMAFLGEDSVEAARAAVAAGGQDRYWQFHSLLFENQGTENSGYVTDAFLEDIARRVPGLDVDRWNEARTGDSPASELREVQNEAASSGVDSTPTLILRGPDGERILSGAESAEDVSAAVREVGGS